MSDDADVKEKILELIERSSPETVEDLIEQAHQTHNIPKDKLLQHVVELQNEGKLTLTSPPGSIPARMDAYLFSSHAIWFWVTIILSTATAISVYTITDKMYPYICLRYILGSIFVIFLPGFTLIKTIFPTREIDNIERTTLSIGMSLVLVPLVCFLLNYTPWGIRLTPITLSLLALTIILSITGLIREYQAKNPEKEL